MAKKNQPNKTTYSQALQMAKGDVNLVNQWIKEGLVGDPSRRKVQNWSFEGTDLTFHPGSPYPRQSKKKGANNNSTSETKLISQILSAGYNGVFSKVKNLQQEGKFSNVDENFYIDTYGDEIVRAGEEGILRFLEKIKKD